MTGIPPITDPLGAYWRQPTPAEILIDETHAVMTRRALEQLAEYSCTIPTGVYEGKMWRRAVYADPTWPSKIIGWLLCWYGPSDQPAHCSINRREILIV